MSGKFYLALFSVFALGACACPQPNLGEMKTRITEYKNSGGYERDFNAAMNKADQYIVSNAEKVSKPAIILDIDETSLSNWPQLKANDYAFYLQGPCKTLPEGPCGLKEWQLSEKAAGFPATLHLYEDALHHDVTIFFITGRPETVRTATEANLRKAGYHHWEKLIMRPAGTSTPSAVDYKAPQRAKIESEGYKIIANIGDQPSDLAGGYADKTFLIPNPFYRIP